MISRFAARAISWNGVSTPATRARSCLELACAAGIDEHRADRVQHLVAGGPRDGPVVGQLLVGREDLLDHDVEVRGLGAQPREVAGRIREPVDVIDPEAGHRPLVDELQDRAVGGLEDVRVLLTQRDEIGDVEEPPVVDPFGGVAPVGEP